MPLLLVSVGLQWHNEAHLIQEKEQSFYLMARDKSLVIQERIQSIKSDLKMAAALPSIARYLLNEADQNQAGHFAEFSHRFISLGNYYDLLLVNKQGRVVFSVLGESDSDADLTANAWVNTIAGVAFNQVKTLLSDVTTEFRYYSPSSRQAAFVATPVWNAQGEWVGVLMVQIREDWLKDLAIAPVGMSQTGEVVITRFDHQHQMIAAAPVRSDPDNMGDLRFSLSSDSIYAAAIAGHDGAGEGVDHQGKRVLAGWVGLPMLSMNLLVKQDLDEVLQPLEAQRYLLMLLIFLMLALLFWAVSKVASVVVQPIVGILALLKNYEAGRWHLRLGTEVDANIEFQKLRLGLNQLADTIEDQFDQLQTQTVQLEEQSAELEGYANDLEELVRARTKDLEQLSLTDPMTGLYNRRHFSQEAPKLWRLVARQKQVLSFMLLDIDKFKEYNDTLGHEAGDSALIAVAHALKENCRRAGDVAFRMGGEEMAILMLVASEDEAVSLGERVLHAIEALNIPHPSSPVSSCLTVSAGLALFDGRGCQVASEEQVDALYRAADKALYEAKHAGRNRLSISPSLHC